MVSLADHTFHMLSRHMGPDNEELDFPLYPDAASNNMYAQAFPFTGLQNFDLEQTDSFNYSRSQDSSATSSTSSYPASAAAAAFNNNPMYTEPPYALESPEMRAAPSSNYSTASGPSAASSVVGSPHSVHGHAVPAPEWTPHGLGLNPGIVGFDNFAQQGTEYNSFAGPGMEEFALEFSMAKPNSFVDPTILHGPYSVRSASAAHSSDPSAYPPPAYPGSPSHSQNSRSPMPVEGDSQSPYMSAQYNTYPYPVARRPSVTSWDSENFSSEESKEKGRCSYPDCGKVFKDLKAHMLTHQTERPEKCPIQTCDYHIKGFARKYDKNRHTLTHYKGTMVCGFCPGSGSAAEKSFNRADVFKRHLTSVHAVEQTPPNSRKKTSTISSGKKLSGYAPDATGKCSTCSATFNNAQDFYEHLDDCVLRIVQQEEPSEAINAARLAEVSRDQSVLDTLRNNSLPTTTTNVYSAGEDDDDDEMDDDNDDDFSPHARAARRNRANRNPANGVQKSRGLTHSKGGVTLQSKGRKKRKDYPSSWGCAAPQMKMKKRTLCVFDGQRRLWKDEMMLDTDYEVRLKLTGNDKRYVTDLDVQTMRRAEAFHTASDEEKGPWVSDDLTGLDLEKLMEVKR